ncbi:hypothetical protein R6Q59_035014 [Mikania micrantha]
MSQVVVYITITRMLSTDYTKKLSFNRYINDGDLVIVYEKHDNMKAVKVCEKSVLENRFGVFKHSDWIGKPYGCKVSSHKGGFVYLLSPTPELWTLVLSHRTQILYIADISFVIMYMEVIFGCVVLESGTGSGSLTTSLARAIAPMGQVYTFDFHEQRVVAAREDFEKTGLSSLVTVGVRDIQGEGFPEDLTGVADAVFLDLPQLWLAIPSAGEMLKQDGVLCSFSPCIEQVQWSSETLTSKFTDIKHSRCFCAHMKFEKQKWINVKVKKVLLVLTAHARGSTMQVKQIIGNKIILVHLL